MDTHTHTHAQLHRHSLTPPNSADLLLLPDPPPACLLLTVDLFHLPSLCLTFDLLNSCLPLVEKRQVTAAHLFNKKRSCAGTFVIRKTVLKRVHVFVCA